MATVKTDSLNWLNKHFEVSPLMMVAAILSITTYVLHIAATSRFLLAVSIFVFCCWLSVVAFNWLNHKELICVFLIVLMVIQTIRLTPSVWQANRFSRGFTEPQSSQNIIVQITEIKQKADQDTWQAFGDLEQMDGKEMVSKVLVRGKKTLPQLGSRCLIEGRVEKPLGARNPGGFSERRWLYQLGVYGVINEAKVREESIDNSLIWRWRRSLARFKQNLNKTINKHLASPEASLFRGLLYGDTTDFSPWQKYAYGTSGMAHLTAVSGANVAFVLAPLRLWQKKRKTRAIPSYLSCAVLMLFYGFLASWSAGVSRSIAGICIYGALQLAGRRISKSNLLGLVLICLFCFVPRIVCQTGFQLSFISFLIVLMVTSRRSPLFVRDKKQLCSLKRQSLWQIPLETSLLVSILTIPWQISINGSWFIWGFCFGMVGLILSQIVTWVGMPILGVTLLYSRIGGEENGWLSRFALGCWQYGLSPWLRSINTLASYGSSLESWHSSSGTIGFYIICWILLIGVMYWRRSRSLNWRLSYSIRLSLCSIALSFVVCISICQLIIQHNKPPWQIIQLDVGQGDAALIFSKSGYTILVDGGNPSNAIGAILPALRAYGKTKIDLAVLSHPDLDHSGGVMELVRLGRIKQVLTARGLDKPTQQLLTKATGSANPFATNDVKLNSVEQGDIIKLADEVSLEVVLPVAKANSETNLNEKQSYNKHSLVVLFRFKELGWVFTGDIGKQEEETIGKIKGLKECGFKVAHHGSKNSSSQIWLDQNCFTHSVISCGRYNRYGHPAKDTLNCLAKSTARVWRTDKMGAVFVNFNETGLELQAPYAEHN